MHNFRRKFGWFLLNILISLWYGYTIAIMWNIWIPILVRHTITPTLPIPASVSVAILVTLFHLERPAQDKEQYAKQVKREYATLISTLLPLLITFIVHLFM